MVIITTVNLSATAERVKPTLRHRRRGRHLIPIALLASAVAVSGLVAVGLGASSLPASTVVRIVAAHLGLAPVDPEISARQDAIVWELRAPRAIGAMLVGATLAAAGAALQAIVRNTLADPFLLGVSSGASLGAASVITLGVGSAIGGLTLMGGAFVGALAAIALVLALVRTGGPAASNRLVLAGITVSFFLAALTNLVVVASGDRDAIRAVMFWMLGSLGATRWEILPWLAILAALMVAMLTLRARRLDAIALGDDVARSLGTDPDRLRAQITALTALGVAAAVAVSGSIGFVGLVVPHLARRLVGASHRVLIPVSALLGALVLVWADTLARTVFSPRELPLGILTALLGTPLLMLLIRHDGSQR